MILLSTRKYGQQIQQELIDSCSSMFIFDIMQMKYLVLKSRELEKGTYVEKKEVFEKGGNTPLIFQDHAILYYRSIITIKESLNSGLSLHDKIEMYDKHIKHLFDEHNDLEDRVHAFLSEKELHILSMVSGNR